MTAATKHPLTKLCRKFWTLLPLCAATCGCLSSDQPSLVLDPKDDDLQPRLLEPLRFADFSVSGIITPQGVERLRREKVRSSGPDTYEFLAHPTTEQYIRTETVDQYLAARAAGYRDRTTVDLTYESWFIEVTKVLQFMAQAKPAQTNTMTTLGFEQLPMRLLNWWGPENTDVRPDGHPPGETIGDYEKAGRLKRMRIGANRLTVDYHHRRYVVSKSACGDFDGDGYMDLLISVAYYYIEGSGRGYYQLVVRGSAGHRPHPVNPILELK